MKTIVFVSLIQYITVKIKKRTIKMRSNLKMHSLQEIWCLLPLTMTFEVKRMVCLAHMLSGSYDNALRSNATIE